MKAKHKKLLFIAFIFLFYLIVAYGSVPAFDDFRWGTGVGVERFNRHFSNYNGRYLGNYIILLITRSKIASALIQATVNTGIILLIHKIFEQKIGLISIMFFFVTLPIGIYQQTYAWMSGFANYLVSTFFILVILYLIKKEDFRLKEALLLFASGLSAQLFLENVTAVNIVISLFFLIYGLFNKKAFKKAILLFSSTVTGSVLMFSNLAYFTNDTSRGLSTMTLSIIPQSFLTLWSEFFFKKNVVLLIFLAFGLYLNLKENNKLKYLVFPIPVYFSFRYLFGIQWNQLPVKLMYLEGFMLILFILMAFYIVYASPLLKDSIKRNFYFYFLLAGLYAGPILLLSQNGRPLVSPRNVITTYVLLIIAILYLYLPVLTKESSFLPKISKVSQTLVLSIMLVISSMSIVNGLADQQRISLMKEEVAMGKEKIEVKELPYRYITFSWGFTNDHAFMPNFKNYYNLPQDIVINEIPIENQIID